MGKIRVLAVDDSVVVRRVIGEVLAAESDFEMAGVAPNGRIALAKMTQLSPDVVILDLDMPVMDGLETLEEIRKRDPKIPVIIFSALTERGAEATLDALFRGATDYVTKPTRMGSADQAARAVREQLLPKIRAFCERLGGREAPAKRIETAPVEPRPRPTHGRPVRVDVVAIGASTGGPAALQVILCEIPKNFAVPILVVQHMPPIFTKFLARQLERKVRVPVQEASAGDVLAAGQVWIAPGGWHMVVKRRADTVRLDTNQNPPEHSCRPAVDVLFRSVAEVYGAHALAVVMTGMGRDGASGCEEIHRRGGQVLVQDQASSVVWGMPGFVASAGLADAVLPPEEVGKEIVRRVLAGGAERGMGEGETPAGGRDRSHRG